MKLTLDQLQVDSYATQISNQELTEVKGGSTPGCIGYVVVGAIAVGVGYLIGSSSTADTQGHAEASCPEGCTVSCGTGASTSQTQNDN